jgi:hypothetical protein
MPRDLVRETSKSRHERRPSAGSGRPEPVEGRFTSYASRVSVTPLSGLSILNIEVKASDFR